MSNSAGPRFGEDADPAQDHHLGSGLREALGVRPRIVPTRTELPNRSLEP